MIQAVRRVERVEHDGLLTLQIPEFTGIEVEVIIMPQPEGVSARSLEMMRLQESSGFASKVLADAGEDVWNGL